MKDIEPPFLSSVLKDIESKIDICSILNKKKNQKINVLKNRRQNWSSTMLEQRLRKVKEREVKHHKVKKVLEMKRQIRN